MNDDEIRAKKADGRDDKAAAYRNTVADLEEILRKIPALPPPVTR